jgi:serine/threonine-protein kinase 24/25/MST4
MMNILGTALEEAQISAICKSVLLGLDYLHSSSMQKVHRDIKSENILINDKGEIKLGMCWGFVGGNGCS